jgi:sugar phosphate isomerase/epimerase
VHAGIFAKTFPRPSLEETLDAVAAYGIRHVQFNMTCVGLAPLPEAIPAATAARVREAHLERGIEMAAVSGTFNTIHPDRGERREGLRRLGALASAAPALGTRLITLSTGTRHPSDPWAPHPENSSREAWKDLVASLREADRIAADAGVTLAFEPEVSNVVDTALKARRLLEEIGSPRLKVVLDAANLFRAGDLARMREVLDEAFDEIGGHIALAHAKDLSRDGEAGHEAAGTGLLDYEHYLFRLRAAGYGGPLILHGLTEAQVPAALAFLAGKIAAAERNGKGGA